MEEKVRKFFQAVLKAEVLTTETVKSGVPKKETAEKKAVLRGQAQVKGKKLEVKAEVTSASEAPEEELPTEEAKHKKLRVQSLDS